MTILFSSLMGGASVVWDKEFGFLKEVMVAPVSRFSILLGRQAGAMTISIGQALIILLIATLMGVNLQNSPVVLLSIVFMVLTSATFMGLGLILATKLGEMEGFMAILSLFQMPLFFMSVALFPLDLMPKWLGYIICLNPFTYGVDGMRGHWWGYPPSRSSSISVSSSPGRQCSQGSVRTSSPRWKPTEAMYPDTNTRGSQRPEGHGWGILKCGLDSPL